MRHAEWYAGGMARGLAVGALALAAGGCPRRTDPAPGHRFAVDAGRADSSVAVARVTVGRGAQGPWRAQGPGRMQGPGAVETAGAAPSPAVLIGGTAYSVLAFPKESLEHSELRWVRWGADGATVVDRRQASGMAPGSALGLVYRAGGYTVLWLTPPRDGGDGALRAQDVGVTGFTGDERAAAVTGSEAGGGQWVREVMARRARERADEPAPVPPSEAGLVTVALRRTVAVVTTGGTEVTQGDDLLGFERAVGAADARPEGEGMGDAGGDGARWVALSRGRCTEARVEVYRVTGGAATLRGSFPIGAELGVRWLTVDPHGQGAAVSWYQELIPLRLECARGAHAPGTADHGVRVAVLGTGTDGG